MAVCVNDGTVWWYRAADTLHDLQYTWHDISPRLEVGGSPLLEPIGTFNVSWVHQLTLAAHPSGVVSVCSLDDGRIVHQWQPHARRTLNMWIFERDLCEAGEKNCLLVKESEEGRV